MSYLKEPPAGIRDQNKLPGDVDGLLRAFFLAEMPEPWPNLEPPVKAATSRKVPPWGRSSLIWSRGVLAASVLLLLIGYWCLSGMHSGATPFTPGPGNDIGAKDGPPRRVIAVPSKDCDAAHPSRAGRLNSGHR